MFGPYHVIPYRYLDYIGFEIPQLDTPILNHYFKSVILPFDLYCDMKQARRKLGLY